MFCIFGIKTRLLNIEASQLCIKDFGVAIYFEMLFLRYIDKLRISGKYIVQHLR